MINFKADADTLQALADIEAAYFNGVFNTRSAAIRRAIIETAERLRTGGARMNPQKTTVLFRFDELAQTSRFQGYVSIAELRRRVASDGVTGATFNHAVLDLESDGILNLIASAAPGSLPPADVRDCIIGPDRELLCSATRRTRS
jgi:hypothetical protein